MAKSYDKVKGRKSTAGRHLQLPYSVYTCVNYTQLSAYDTKLLIDIAIQFNGKNNGDLCASWAVMKNKGWKSPDTLNNSLKHILFYGFIELTRQGGRNLCSLYAVTWKPINECKNKLDIKETITPSNNWQIDNGKYKLLTRSKKPTKKLQLVVCKN